MRHYSIKFKNGSIRNMMASSWILTNGFYEFMDGNGVIIARIPSYEVQKIS